MTDVAFMFALLKKIHIIKFKKQFLFVVVRALE